MNTLELLSTLEAVRDQITGATLAITEALRPAAPVLTLDNPSNNSVDVHSSGPDGVNLLLELTHNQQSAYNEERNGSGVVACPVFLNGGWGNLSVRGRFTLQERPDISSPWSDVVTIEEPPPPEPQ
jgi:hypothetical protein